MIQATTQSRIAAKELPLVSDFSGTQDRDSRIRAALGVAGSRFPRVQMRWLHNYYEHLAAHLQFPFQAHYAGDLRFLAHATQSVVVVAVLDPSTDSRSESSGLQCTVQRGQEEFEASLADLEVDDSHPNFQFIEDYWYWYWNWRFDRRL